MSGLNWKEHRRHLCVTHFSNIFFVTHAQVSFTWMFLYAKIIGSSQKETITTAEQSSRERERWHERDDMEEQWFLICYRMDFKPYLAVEILKGPSYPWETFNFQHIKSIYICVHHFIMLLPVLQNFFCISIHPLISMTAVGIKEHKNTGRVSVTGKIIIVFIY